MTTIQEVLLEPVGDYMGHPYFVTGHALYNALARRVDARTRKTLTVSMGVFVPGEFGSYPDEHSQSGGVPYMGTGLRPVEAYEDLFLYRDPAQRWLSETRPRDTHNTHDLHSHGGRQAFAPTCRFGRPPEARNTKRTMHWYLHCFVHTDEDENGILPLAESVLDGLRVGGARNYGLGKTLLAETQVIDVDALDYSRVRSADEPKEPFLRHRQQFILQFFGDFFGTEYVAAETVQHTLEQFWWFILPFSPPRVGGENGKISEKGELNVLKQRQWNRIHTIE